jgi:hypothetical protein
MDACRHHGCSFLLKEELHASTTALGLPCESYRDTGTQHIRRRKFAAEARAHRPYRVSSSDFVNSDDLPLNVYQGFRRR